MAAGTITLTNQSATVYGEDTEFLSAVNGGDFILITVGGASYFLPVVSVISNTELSLAAPYDGPTTSGLAWEVVAKGAYASVPVGLIAESARALRGQNLDKDNWQKLFNVDGEITVRLVDGSQFTGPSWLKVSKVFNEVSLESLLVTAKQVREDAETASDAASTATDASNAATTAQAASESASSKAEASESAAKAEAAAAAEAKSAAAESEKNANAANQAAQSAKTDSEAAAAAASGSDESAKASADAAASSESAASVSASSASNSSQSAQAAQSAAEGAQEAAESANGEAQDAKAAAAASASVASGAADTATAQAAEATNQAELAKQYADSIDPDSLLLKSNNLSDVESKSEALQNLQDGKPLPLVSDPVSQYDAVTKRYAENLIGAGTVGPTMNGVMNYGVGTTSSWASRAYIPPYALPMDGQLVNRADWPELWAHAQQHGAIADSAWVGDKTQRGKYSTGDGSTTFRLPDLNGVQTKGANGFTGEDSIRALFVRGDGGGGISAGTVSPSGAPNITGNFDIRFGRSSGGIGYGMYLSGSGSLYGQTINTGASAEPVQFASQGTTSFQRVLIDAGRSSSVYGGTTTEIRTNNFSAVWIVRASGGFVAANTQWDVINADDSTPGDGTYVTGGRVRSTYNIGTANEIVGGLRVGKTIGQNGKGDLTLFTSESDGAGGTADSLYSLKGPSGDILTDVQSGWMGVNGVAAPNNANDIKFSGLYAAAGSAGVNYGNNYSPLLHMSRYTTSGQAQLQIQPEGILYYRGAGSQGGAWSDWHRAVTTKDEQYYAWNDAAVSQYVTFPNCTSSATELRVKISQTHIHIVGILRWASPQTGTQSVINLIKGPAGIATAYCPYQQCLSQNGGSGYTEAANGFGQSITYNHRTFSDAWLMVNHTITFP